MLRSVMFYGFTGLFLLLISGIYRPAYGQAPIADIDVNDTIVCVGNTIVFTDLSVPGSAPITNWNWTFGDGGSSSAQHPSYAYTTGGNYTVTLVVTDANGNTGTATQTIYVLIAQAITNTVRICSPQSSTTITAIDPAISGVSGIWFTASGAVLGTPGNDTTLVSNLLSGTYLIFWVVSDGVCSAADQVTIIVDQPVTVNAGPDQQICSTPGSTTLAASSPSPGTGIWSTTSTGNIANPSNRNTGVSGMTSAGTYTFVWTVTNGSCITNDTVNIIVSSPVTANAGADQQICSSPGTSSLSASSPSPGTGLWTTTSSAVIANATSPSSSVSGLNTAGVYTFIWRVTNGACITRDTMQIVVTAPVTANAGANIQVCTSTAQGTLNGNNPSPGTGLWTALNGGTITSPSSATTTVTGLSTPGFYNFVWTITNGLCVSRDTVVFIVRAPVVANAGSDQTLCNTFTATLSGNNPSPGTGTWSTTGAATIASPSSATTTVSGLSAGVNTFIYTTSYGACISRDTMSIRVDPLVISNAGPDQSVCESQTSVTMSANNATPGTGMWTKLNGGTITSPSNPLSTITGLTAGTHLFVWTITNGACVSTDTVRIIVSVQIPSNAGLDQQICQSTATSLSGNNPMPATGLWTTPTSALLSSPSNPSTSVSGLNNAGVYVFVWTVTNGACILRDTVRITVDSLRPALAGPDQNLCNVTTATLAGNAAAPGTGTWTTTGSAVIANASLANSGVSNLAFGNNRFIWTITNGTCISRDTIVIRVDSVVTATAGPDQSICSSLGTAVMAANTPAAGTGTWTTTSSATIANAASPSTTVSGLTTAGNYTFIWTIANGTCISRDTIVITVTQAVTALAGPDQNLCSVTTATLAGNTAAPGTGTWTTTGSAVIANASLANSGVSNLAFGNNRFIWTITNGTCISRDTIVIRVDSVVTATAGPDQSICSSLGTAVMAANTPAAGTGTWTTTSSATIANAASPSTTVSGLTTAGNYTFIWTITNGTCISRDTIVITVTQAVTALAGPDQNLCNVTTATLAGNAAAPGTGTWTTTGSAVIANASLANSGVSNLAFGNNRFIWTITNGTCISRDTIVIRVDSVVTATAGPDQSICSSLGTAVMAANTPAAGTGTWTTTSSATIANAASPSTTVSGLTTAGNYTFIWTITNGTCISRDTIVITVTQAVTALAGPDQNLCNVTTATLAGNAAAPGTGTWTTASAAIIGNITDENTGISGLSNGQFEFIWTITNGACTSSDTVVVAIDTLEIADAGTDQQVCSGATVIMSGNTPVYGVGLWMDLNGGNIVDPNNENTSITGITNAGTYDFVWNIINGVCISTDSIRVVVDSLVPAQAGADQSLCETQTSTNLAAILPSLGTGTWTTNSSASITDVNDPSTQVSGLIPGTYDFVWTVVNGNCTSSDTVSVSVSTLATTANAGADQQACADMIMNLNGNTPVVGTGNWTSSGSALVDNPLDEHSTVSSLAIGANTFIWTITNGGCNSNDTVVLIVNPLPVSDAGADQYVVSGSNVTLGGTPSASGGTGSYTYSWTPGASLSDSTVSNPDVTVMVTTVFFITVTDSLGCNSSDTIVVYINNPPDAQTDSLTTAEDTPISFDVLLNDTDPDNNIDTTSIVILQGPLYGSVTIGPGGQISYAPAADYYGLDSLLYMVCDSGMPVYCDSAWVYFNVTPVNDPPLVVDDFGATVEDSCIQLAILSNDSDIENMLDLTSLVIVSGPSHGTFTLDPLTGILNYCPDSNFTGIDTLVYSVCDSGFPLPVLCDTGMVIITVTPDNDPPVAVNDTAVACSGDPHLILALSNDFDPEGDSLSLSVVLPPSGGTVLISPTQEIIYTSLPGFGGWDSLQYVICDQQTIPACDTAWVFIFVHALASASTVVTDVLCSGDSTGSIDLTVTPVGTFIYSWSNGTADQDIDSLIAGIYTVSVLDTNGCVLTISDTVSGPLSPLTVFVTAQQIMCFGDVTGSIDLQVSGGVLPYSFSWDNGSTDEDLDSLIAGTYNVLVTDSNACHVNTVITITAPDSTLIASLVTTDILCAGDSSGSMVAAVSGGTPGYSYSWSNGEISSAILNSHAGTFTVTVTDTNGCQIVLTDTILELNPPLLLNENVVYPVCIQHILGEIQVTVNGGVPPLSYVWNTGDTTNTVDSLSVGVYQLTVTDAVGCNVSATYDLQDSSGALIVINGSNTFCDGDSVLLSVNNVSGLSYQWIMDSNPLPGDTLHQLIVHSSGAYEVSVLSGCGVFTDGPLTVTAFPIPIVNAGMDVFTTCDSSLALSAMGALNYSWLPASLCTSPLLSNTNVSPVVTTWFVVTGTDGNGCSASDSVLVTVTCDSLIIPGGFSPNGDNFNDYFIISNIERYPNAILKIYNRWGLLVYEKVRYNNTWNGFANSDLIRMGEELPDGTYYYLLDLADGKKPLNGYVVLRR